MLRTSLSALALLVAAPAFAGGIVHTPPPVQPPVVPVAADDWTEFYIGGQVDLIAASEAVDPFNIFSSFEFEGHLIGIFAGYRYDLGTFVVGAEIDYMIGTLDVVDSNPQNPTFASDTTLFRAGVEAGYDLGDVLVYGTGGYAEIEAENNFGPGTTSADGYFAGLGLDYRVSESIVVGTEVLYHSFDSFAGFELDITTVGLNVAFTF